MKNFMAFIIIYSMFWVSLPAENQKLSAIDSLKELPVKLEADFSSDEAIASPAMPVILKSGLIYFYDSKLRQLYKTHLQNRALIPIGREGEGPKEYSAYVPGMLCDDECLYLIDSKGKLLCFGIDGVYKWEEAMHKPFNKITGKVGDKLYLEAYDGDADSMNLCLFEWMRRKSYRSIKSLPVLFSRGIAIINGKRVEGGGFFPLMVPVFSITGDWLISNAGPEYKLDLLNLKTNRSKYITVEATKPEFNEALKNYPTSGSIQAYSIIRVFETGPYITVISNYFNDQKPRLDIFTLDGKWVGSYLAPFKMEGSQLPFTIQGNFLIYSDIQETGFKVFRLPVF